MMFHMQMVVSYKDQYLDHHHHLDQEKQHLYHFLQEIKLRILFILFNRNFKRTKFCYQWN